jgi:hypothetical protein
MLVLDIMYNPLNVYCEIVIVVPKHVEKTV